MSKIEWTQKTWNPIAGCSDVSEGCRHCYARTMAKRLEAMGTPKYAGLTVLQGSKTVWTGKIAFDHRNVFQPLKRKKPTRYFVNSMSDLFHENVTDEMLDRIFAVMSLCPQHTFQVLTKRPARMREYLLSNWPSRLIPWLERWQKRPEGWGVLLETRNGILPNVWLGVSVENQKAADERIPLLLQTPAAKRFISAEPLLGPLNLSIRWIPSVCDLRACRDVSAGLLLHERPCSTNCVHDELPLGHLDWVIVGGESGPGARPMHPDWARDLLGQCVAAGVPFFFKQHGEWISMSDYDFVGLGHSERYTHQFVYSAGVKNEAELPISCFRVGKKVAGRLLDGREWNEMPEVQR